MRLGDSTEVNLGAVKEKSQSQGNGNHLRVDVHLDDLGPVETEALSYESSRKGPQATCRNHQ
jgi:hypothetical protein